MKQQLLGLALASLTVGAIAFYPHLHDADAAVLPKQAVVAPPKLVTQEQQRPRVDLVFVLDTTGSMSGLIAAAKEKIWSIATTMARAQPAPEIRIGLVAYRDHGDQYVTKVFDLTTDLDSMYAQLMDFKAEGGGDGPEAVNEALQDAISRMSWNTQQASYKAVFLVGDAPPHMDYQNDVKYPATMALARQRGIVVNTIQCGSDASASAPWREIAMLGSGDYLEVAQDGNAVALTTPFDDKLAHLAAALDETRLYYGDEKMQAEKRAKMAATAKLEGQASPASKARRATFNASDSGAANLLGEQELVRDVASGHVRLEDIKKEDLPAPLQAMAPAVQAAYLKDNAVRRDALKKEMQEAASARADFLKRKVAETGGAADSLDAKLFDTLRAQAKRVGAMELDKDGPAY
jgi:Mg-chelatase subunit ChlD